MDRIQQIELAINNGIAHRSKLTEEALQVPSFTSIKNRHILNNLGAISRKYTEVGLHKGGTFVSTCFGNTHLIAWGVDDWSEFNNDGDTQQQCLNNVNGLIKQEYLITDEDFFLLSDDILPKEVDLYFYDGSHNYTSQKKAITHFYNSLADEAIIIVDDWSWKTVQQGTFDGIKETGLRILYDRQLTTGVESDNDGFWNGLYIAFLKKGNE